MFAIAKYKAVQVFEYNGESYGLGSELYLEDADGENLVKEEKVVQVRYLDPENVDDKAIIDSFTPVQVAAAQPEAPAAAAAPVEAAKPKAKRSSKK